jgi:hypothetical protein
VTHSSGSPARQPAVWRTARVLTVSRRCIAGVSCASRPAGKLPPALVLRYYADLPEAEVAVLLGCTTGTVKTHTHRGLRALRETLGEEHYGQRRR